LETIKLNKDLISKFNEQLENMKHNENVLNFKMSKIEYFKEI